MYESLLSLPYFQGMSKDDITAILDNVAFEFVKHNDGDCICHRGDSCFVGACILGHRFDSRSGKSVGDCADHSGGSAVTGTNRHGNRIVP